MPATDPLTTSVSTRVKSAETSVPNTHHADAVQTLLRARAPQPLADSGHRFHSDEAIIGLALGSPNQSPIFARSPDKRDRDDSCVCNTPGDFASRLANVYEIDREGRGIKRKGSKWKSLGSLFGRRETRFAPSYYQLNNEQQPEPVKELITRDLLETNVLRRKRAVSNHDSKAHQVDSLTVLSGEESNGLLRRTSLRRRGLRRRRVEEPQPEMHQIFTKNTTPAIPENSKPHGENQIPTSGLSLLQVEIPCVELERYSVMFGDVLKPMGWQSKPQPPLLARRQAHLEELNIVADTNREVIYPVMVINRTTSSWLCDSLLTLLGRTPLYELIRYHSRPLSLRLSHSSPLPLLTRSATL